MDFHTNAGTGLSSAPRLLGLVDAHYLVLFLDRIIQSIGETPAS